MHKVCGMPGRIRTCDLQSRSLTLYPTELRALNGRYFILFRGDCQGVRRAEFCMHVRKTFSRRKIILREKHLCGSDAATQRAAYFKGCHIADFP